jgi:hypothetical protein
MIKFRAIGASTLSFKSRFLLSQKFWIKNSSVYYLLQRGRNVLSTLYFKKVGTSGADAIKKCTPSLGIPYLGVS